MKRLLFFIVTIFISCSLLLHADDFIREENVPSDFVIDRDWCSFNDVGYSLPIHVEKTNSNNFYVSIYNNDWTIRKIFTITGLSNQDAILEMDDDYSLKVKVSQYFFNDDDKYEIIIGTCDEQGNFGNVRVINEDGVILGTLPNCGDIHYRAIGNRHYIYDHNNDKWYSFPGQTGAPLMRNSKDVNGDGYVTSADVTAIYDELLGN